MHESLKWIKLKYINQNEYFISISISVTVSPSFIALLPYAISKLVGPIEVFQPTYPLVSTLVSVEPTVVVLVWLLTAATTVPSAIPDIEIHFCTRLSNFCVS